MKPTQLKITLALLSVVFFICCKQRLPKGYTEYQTFDEYTLQGVPSKTEDIKRPCVHIKQTDDTIWVIEPDRKYETKYSKRTKGNIYVKKEGYWHCIIKQVQKCQPNPYNNCDTLPFYIEKFIFNDTLLTLQYHKTDNFCHFNSLWVDTKDRHISIQHPINFNPDSLFFNIRNLARNYSTITTHWENDSVHTSYYETSTKIFRDNFIFMYAHDQNSKTKCLESVYEMNSLGEFDSELYSRSVIDKTENKFYLKNENLCY